MRLVFLALAFASVGGAFLLADAGRTNESWACWTAAVLLLVCTLSYRPRR